MVKVETFLAEFLQPWLQDLFTSNKVVLYYIKANLLLGSQLPEDRLENQGFQILEGCNH